MSDLPVLGAALTIESLESHIDWLIADQRDLELQDFCYAGVLAGDWKPLARRIGILLADHDGRLGIHGPYPGLDISTEDPDVRSVVKTRLMQGLNVCEEIGATHMVVHSPYTAWDHENLLNSRTGPEDKLGHVMASMEDAVVRAEDIGVVLVVENCEDREPDRYMAMTEIFDSDAVGVSIDTGHAYYAHTIGNGPPVDRFVRAAGDRLAHMHLQDADGYADRHWQLGAGTVPWHAVFAEISKITSNPRLIIELRDKAGVIPSADWLAEQGLAR